MKIIILFALLSATPLFAAQYEANVIDVVDGDTLIVETKAGPKTVHVGGYEAPEPGQPFYQEAKELTIETIGGRSVTVKDINIKKSIVNITTANHRSLPIIHISQGYGWVAEPVRPIEKEMEIKARMKKIGVWSKPNPESPWAYRKRHGRGPEIGIKIGDIPNNKKILESMYGDKVQDIKRDADGSALGEGGGVAFSNKSVPFSDFGGSTYWESSARTNNNNLKQDCKDKWGPNYRMVNYCISTQSAAKRSVARNAKDMELLQYCEERWAGDWTMIQYCYGNQKVEKRRAERY